MIGSTVRVGLGLVFMAGATLVHAVVLLLLLPSRNLRIRSCNLWGWVTGRFMLWISGSTLRVHGREHLDGRRPAIYVSNHTSALDIFIGISQGPLGTVGVAKKEVVFYPFFGQLYWLSGHLRLDRADREKALDAMKELEQLVREHGLSIWMWPEGTRSRDGRLLPFKKGIWHLAVSTGLPVVPVVVAGAQRAWVKGSLAIRPTQIDCTVLPAIDTSGWKDRPMEEVLQELHGMFVAYLPPEQQPVPLAA